MWCQQAQAGKLLIAGAAGDPVDGGLFVFQNTTKEVDIAADAAHCFELHLTGMCR